MAIQIIGSTGTVLEIDSDHSSERMSMRPLAVGALGHYRVAVQTGAIAAGMSSDGALFSARWTSSSALAVITSIRVTGMRATTAFAAGAIDIKATKATGFSASDSGGTALTLTGDQAQMRTSFGASLFGDMRVATTAALTAGTRTLDTQDLGQITTHSSGGVGSATPIIGSIYLPRTELFEADVHRGESPLVLTTNEGVIVRATVPATGVWNLGVEMVWAEVTAY